MMRALFLLLAVARVAEAAPAGEATPRALALGGADVAVTGGSPLSAGSVADLGRMDGAIVAGGGGFATQGGGSFLLLSAGGVVGGFGLAGSVSGRSRGLDNDLDAGIAAGMPAGAPSGLSVGVGVRALTRSLETDAGMGFALEAGAAGRFDTGWQGIDAAAGVAVENALGMVSWNSGGKQEIPMRARAGVGAFRGPVSVLAGVTVVRGPRTREAVPGAGGEYALRAGEMAVAVRAGWHGTPGTACAGFGVSRGPASLDYAVAVSGGGVLHSLSAEWRIPGSRTAAPATAPLARRAPARKRGAEVVPESADFVFDSPYRTLSLAIRVPADEVVRSWTVIVASPGGSVVWEASGRGMPPVSVSWPGNTLTGDPVPSGAYVCRLMLRGPGAPDYMSPGSSVRVVRPRAGPATSARGPAGFDEPGGGR